MPAARPMASFTHARYGGVSDGYIHKLRLEALEFKAIRDAGHTLDVQVQHRRVTKRVVSTLGVAVLLVVTFAFTLSVAIAQTTAGVALGTSNQPASQVHTLSRAELDALLAKPQQVLIIDVRRPG